MGGICCMHGGKDKHFKWKATGGNRTADLSLERF
jgi:hypothetical protein